MPQYSTHVRAAARLLYLDGRTPLSAIAKQLCISDRTLRKWAESDGWQRGSQPATEDAIKCALDIRHASPAASAKASAKRSAKHGAEPSNLVTRLYAIIERSITLLENKMSDDANEYGELAERDMRALGSLVRSIEKLKDLEPGHPKPDANKPHVGQPKSAIAEEERLRKRIVERILKLRERHTDPGSNR